MSRKSIAEYIADKRRAYAQAGSVKRSRLLDDTCVTLGYTRKYVIKLLTGNILYRERKGRGKTYGGSVLANARRIWETVGCPCTTYFVAELPRIVREYEECVSLIKPKEDREAILALSASTLDRVFKGLPRTKPFFVKLNRRSGRNRPILDAIECRSGEEVMACNVKPGGYAGRHRRPLWRRHARKILLDADADRQEHAVDGNHADVEPGTRFVKCFNSRTTKRDR